MVRSRLRWQTRPQQADPHVSFHSLLERKREARSLPGVGRRPGAIQRIWWPKSEAA
jgi:hypothetical protein